ncbi:MAG: hypothetical protein DHS20C10_09870 [marine bacterium B5-7]|nr:MAG: hypothetical protein DHS20C10_09870 [marine bacterium B5-7]
MLNDHSLPLVLSTTSENAIDKTELTAARQDAENTNVLAAHQCEGIPNYKTYAWLYFASDDAHPQVYMGEKKQLLEEKNLFRLDPNYFLQLIKDGKISIDFKHPDLRKNLSNNRIFAFNIATFGTTAGVTLWTTVLFDLMIKSNALLSNVYGGLGLLGILGLCLLAYAVAQRTALPKSDGYFLDKTPEKIKLLLANATNATLQPAITFNLSFLIAAIGSSFSVHALNATVLATPHAWAAHAIMALATGLFVGLAGMLSMYTKVRKQEKYQKNPGELKWLLAKTFAQHFAMGVLAYAINIVIPNVLLGMYSKGVAYGFSFTILPLLTGMLSAAILPKSPSKIKVDDDLRERHLKARLAEHWNQHSMFAVSQDETLSCEVEERTINSRQEEVWMLKPMTNK